MEKLKEYKGLIVVILIIVAIVIFTSKNKKPKEIINNNQPESSALSEKMTDEDINNEIDSTLETLMTIHYVSVIEKQSNDPNSVILDELQESMNDLNKLKGVMYKAESLSSSKNEIISTTGLALKVTILSLEKSYGSWIEYLRSVDMNNADLSEFQYQLALFGTSTHDAYLKLMEGASLLPMITVEFAKEEGKENTINENLKSHFLSKIDDLFKDILVDNEKYYKETKNRYAVAILIQNYIDFFKD